MNKSDTITTIAAALAKAHANIGAAIKGADNPFFKSRYADLGDVLAVCKEPLTAQGISVVQMPYTKENSETWLDTMLLHSSGEYIGTEMKVTPNKANDIQALGSAITYCRRYSLQAMLSIPSVDDDAEWAERALRNKPNTEAKREEAAGTVEKEFAPEKEKVSTSKQPTDWREVTIHFGDPAKSEYFGRKLGELARGQLRWVCENWVKLGGKTKQDQELAAILATIPVEEYQKPAETPEPPKEVSTPPPKPEKPVATAKNAKAKPPEKETAGIDAPAKPSLEAKPIEWKSRVIHIPNKKCEGKTLGEIDLPTLRAVHNQLLPKIADSADPKDRNFRSAVRAGCLETGCLLSDSGDMETEKLRKAIVDSFSLLGVDTAEANKILTESSVFADKEELETVDEKMLRHLAKSWELVTATVKQAKEAK